MTSDPLPGMPNVTNLVRDLYDKEMRKKVAHGRQMAAHVTWVKLVLKAAAGNQRAAERIKAAKAKVNSAASVAKKAQTAEDRARAKLVALLEDEKKVASISDDDLKAVTDYVETNKRP
ncbi:MAG: hypothetical protein ABSC94_31780 [Polyangiaceae bacterium]